MSEIPIPRSRSQILGEQEAVFLARHGIPALKVGGPILSILEAASTSDFRSTVDIFAVLNAIDLDSAEGTALDAIGRKEGVTRQELTESSGTVTVGDATFNKIASLVFAGTPAPIVGSIAIDVADASAFPSTGAVYLGRGTSRYEGPIGYTSKVDNGTYWTLNLSSPTLRFHNHGETVILSQGGDRSVDAGAIVRVPRSSIADEVDFRLIYRAIIPDGEVSLSGVAVIATQPGSVGNAPKGAIREWSNPPWANATVSNSLPYNNGFDVEDEDHYRERIREARASRIKAVRSALVSSAIGVVSPDEGRRVLSASYIARKDVPSLLVVDDGTGYEEISRGIAVEILRESSVGGENDLSLQNTPVAKASLSATVQAPYALPEAAQLALRVGGELSVHVFDRTLFANSSAASAHEIVASINGNDQILFAARTVNGGESFAVYARGEEGDDLRVVVPEIGNNANDIFGLPDGLAQTLLLYKNDRPLRKDGRPAKIPSRSIVSWDSFAGPQTLTISVDGTPATTYTITDQDFVNANTGFLAVGRNTVPAWAAVLTAKLPGITATVDGSSIVLKSNKGSDLTASLSISGGTLVDNRVFTEQEAFGVSRDFTLERSQGLIRLTQAAEQGDAFTAGTLSPRAFIQSPAISPTTLTSDGHLWLAPDSAGQILTHGLTASTPISIAVDTVSDWGTRLVIRAFPVTTPTASVFEEIEAGDWLILWDSILPSAIQGAWRVTEVGSVTVGPDTFKTKIFIERRTAHSARVGHKATALVPVGSNISRVFVCGGWVGPTTSATVPKAVTNTAEIGDISTGLWSAVAAMTTARAYHTATTLNDGRVLVVGGIDQSGTALASVEIYNPSLGTWAAGPSYQVATSHHVAVKLSDGRVLVAGGRSGTTYRTQTAIFDPTLNAWGANIPMGNARADAPAVLLPDGRVLISGGYTTGGTAMGACEILNPAVPSWSATGAMTVSRANHGLALVGSSPTTAIAVGDDRGNTHTDTYSVFTISGGTWASAVALPSSAVFEAKDLVTTQAGNVLALFGRQGSTPWSAYWNGSAWTSTAAPFYADSASRDDVALVLLYNNAASYLNNVVTVGGLDPSRLVPTASVEQYSGTGNAWSVPDAAVVGNTVFSEVGISFVRTNRWMQDITLPAATGYTAGGFANAITGRGVTAETYKTTHLRLRTNSEAIGGDILLAAANTEGQGTGLEPAIITNEVSPFASVVSASGIGTPNFTLERILEEGFATGTGVASVVRINRTDIDGSKSLVLTRNHDDGIYTSPHARYGRNAVFKTTSEAINIEVDATRIPVRTIPDGGFAPLDRCWSAASYALGPSDSFTLIIDDDATTKLFSVPMKRAVTPTGDPYGSQFAIKDADNGGVTLATAFGIQYSFDDFAVMMKARGVLYSTTSSKKMIARYYLHGAAGERGRVRVSYPTAANASAVADVNVASGTYLDIRLRLPGGAARTLSGIRSSTRIGLGVTAVSSGIGTVIYVVNLPVASATRDGSDNSTLTLTLPSGIINHGFGSGDILFLNSSDPNWTPGNVTLTSVTPTTITFNNPLLGSGVASSTNIGTISADAQGEATFQGASIATNDFLRVDSNSGLTSNFKGETFRVTGSANGYVTAVAVEKTISSTQTTLSWNALNSASYFQVWVNPATTASTFVSSINQLASADSSTCPVTLSVLGSGSGTLVTGTIEDEGSSTAWITLKDGINWVARTVLPSTPSDDYQIVLKEPVDSTLITGAGWGSEDVRLVPITTDDIVEWLRTPGITGLFTAAEVALVLDGEAVQIQTLTAGSGGTVQVQGGLANSGIAAVLGPSEDVGSETNTRVLTSDAAGLVAGTWVEARNTVPGQRLGVFTSSTVLDSWDASGYMTFSSTTLWTQRFSNTNVRLHWERQGRYVVVSDPAGTNADGSVTLTGLVEGDYVRFTAASSPTSFAQASTANLGIFRVVRVTSSEISGAGGAIWLENDLDVPETAECDLLGISYNSVIPGDTIQISHDIWNHDNRGTWTVEAVGVTAGTTSPQFANTTVLKVSTADRIPVAISSSTAALGASSPLAVIAEGIPSKMLKKIMTICPDPTDGTVTVIRLDSSTLSRLVSASQRTVLYEVDKLGFSTSRVAGTNGYSASVGLVGEVNRVIQGDPTDEVAYPGVAAAGGDTLVQGPVVHRVTLSLLARVASGATTDDIEERIKETAAAEINRNGVGVSPALSGVVRETSKVQGVEAITILSPAYDAAHDTIPVASDEKALVLSLDDISVGFVSS